MNRPVFSVLHTTARTPSGWMPSYRHWIQSAANPASFEYILAVDAGEEAKVSAAMAQEGIGPAQVKLVVNHGPRSCVAGWNRAAEVAEGHILILNSDDMFAPANWDAELLATVQSARKSVGFLPGGRKDEFVIHISTGSPRDAELITLPIFSASRYHRLGYALWPEYPSVFCDDDFTQHAYADQVVIDARHLTFRHENPYLGAGQMDEVYERENRSEAYRVGLDILNRRKAAGFPPLPWRGGANIVPQPKRAKIALALPGSVFSARWMMNLFGLIGDLESSGYEVIPPFNCYSSDPGVTRETLLEALLACEPKPDYVLWMDDDNLLDSHNFAKLMLDLESFPELSAVFAWCWIQADGYGADAPPRTSCGRVSAATGIGEPFSLHEMWDQAKAGNLMSVGYSGFPAVLMRFVLLERLERFPFCPIPGPEHRHGRTGEDFAFCRRAIAQGFTLAVDPQVKIPHLKLGAHEPDLSKFVVMTPPKTAEQEPQEEPRANAAD